MSGMRLGSAVWLSWSGVAWMKQKVLVALFLIACTAAGLVAVWLGYQSLRF